MVVRAQHGCRRIARSIGIERRRGDLCHRLFRWHRSLPFDRGLCGCGILDESGIGLRGRRDEISRRGLLGRRSLVCRCGPHSRCSLRTSRRLLRRLHGLIRLLCLLLLEFAPGNHLRHRSAALRAKLHIVRQFAAAIRAEHRTLPPLFARYVHDTRTTARGALAQPHQKGPDWQHRFSAMRSPCYLVVFFAAVFLAPGLAALLRVPPLAEPPLAAPRAPRPRAGFFSLPGQSMFTQIRHGPRAV